MSVKRLIKKKEMLERKINDFFDFLNNKSGGNIYIQKSNFKLVFDGEDGEFNELVKTKLDLTKAELSRTNARLEKVDEFASKVMAGLYE